MIARLTRFYGGDPWRWLAELPLGVVRAMVKAIPKLQAEEALSAVQQVACGTGSFANKRDERAVLDTWTRHAGIQRPAPVKASPEMLAAAGIGVTLVETPR